MRFFFAAMIFLAAHSVSAQVYIPKFDIQGHRGARGLKPENTIPAFMFALDSGATTLEMDLAITKDGQVIVSHEPWMSAAICLDPSGMEIKEKEEKKFNIFKMTYEQVKSWDCGSKKNVRFPEQENFSAVKPLLRDVIVTAENHIKNYSHYEVDYNLEINSSARSRTFWSLRLTPIMSGTITIGTHGRSRIRTS